MRANWLDAPDVAFYGIGNDSRRRATAAGCSIGRRVGVATRVQAARFFAVGAGLDAIQMETGATAANASFATASPSYAAACVRGVRLAQVARVYEPRRAYRGRMVRLPADQRRRRTASAGIDAEVQQFVPILRENSVIASSRARVIDEHRLRKECAVHAAARSRRQPLAAR